MKIANITTRHLRCALPASASITTSQREYNTREVALVIVETDNGLTGVGESLGYPPVVISIIQNCLAPLLIGQPADDIHRLWQTMLRGSWFRSQSGVSVEALSAIDIALWDLKGKALGVPVYSLLGGASRKEIPVYATGMYFKDAEELVDEAAALVEAGFRSVKMKIGYPEGVQKDIAQVSRVRSAIGDQIALMVDANGAYGVPEAIAVSRELRYMDVRWMEEPLRAYGPHHDLDGYRQLKLNSEVPIAWGEAEYLTEGILPYLTGRCIDVLQPDVCRFGGITECQRAIVAARLFNTRYAPHFWTTGIGLAATLHLAAAAGDHFLLCELDQSLNPMRDQILEEPFVLKDGALRVPDGPGLGITLNHEWLDSELQSMSGIVA